MGDEWKNNSMLCYIKWDIFVDIEDDSRHNNLEDKFASQLQLMSDIY